MINKKKVIVSNFQILHPLHLFSERKTALAWLYFKAMNSFYTIRGLNFKFSQWIFLHIQEFSVASAIFVNTILWSLLEFHSSRLNSRVQFPGQKFSIVYVKMNWFVFSPTESIIVYHKGNYSDDQERIWFQ